MASPIDSRKPEKTRDSALPPGASTSPFINAFLTLIPFAFPETTDRPDDYIRI
jgi:hypothetical protein